MHTNSTAHRRCAAIFFGLFLIAVAAAPARAAFNVFSVGGTTSAASITPTVDSFRAAIGDPNNGNNPGPLATGRREINWDGGGAATSTTSATPFAGFQNTRGATFTTPGTNFLQTPLGDAALTGIQASYATTFAVFSAQRVFTPLGSNITDVTFSIAGTGGATPAFVRAFGAVFSDVDLANTTKIELFDPSGAALGSAFNVPQQSVGATAPNGGLSFLGLVANAAERIGRVRITTGNQALGLPDSNGDPVDVAVMDDFIYSEPTAIPEPASIALSLGALAGFACLARSRR